MSEVTPASVARVPLAEDTAPHRGLCAERVLRPGVGRPPPRVPLLSDAVAVPSAGRSPALLGPWLLCNAACHITPIP